MNLSIDVTQILNLARSKIRRARDLKELNALKVEFLGRKGVLTRILKSLSSLPLEERRRLGQSANRARVSIEEMAKRKTEELLRDSKEKIYLDPTMPGQKPAIGHLHIISQLIEELVQIFRQVGFGVADGPEIETEENNFDLLNIPKDHPARDEWDTFWLAESANSKFKTQSSKLLLRTHTSPVQIRYMKVHKPPIQIIVPGRTYRYENEDASHSSVFYQLEGLMVDENITVSHLRGILEYFIRAVLGKDKKLRLRPSFFPFTEPSYEVDVYFKEKKKWLELLGAGMVHPQVLRNVGIDSDRYTGFAFGLGIERLAMVRYGIGDIRYFMGGDLRFLKQF